MKKYFLFIIACLFSQLDVHSQMAPCVDGMAGVYPCSDYDLMAHIPLSVLASSSGTPTGSDIWGWTDPLDGSEYAIICLSNSTAFVNISDPIDPIFLGRINTSGGISKWRDVKVYNNYAFIVADNVGAHGMQVFDLTRLRGVTTPQAFIVDALYTGVDSCHNIVINESEAVAYLVACDILFGGGPVFVDISDPLNPSSLGGYAPAGQSHDAQVVTYNGPDTDYTGREIYIGSNEQRNIVILDVTDKNNVIEISEFGYPQIKYAHQGWFTEDQRYFILGDEADEQNFGFNSRTLIFDFSDLDNPVLSSTYFGTTRAVDHNGYIKGNKYFLANYRAGLRILNIDNIASPNNPMTEVGYFDTFSGSDSPNFNGAWSVYPYFSSGNIVISDTVGGLYVVRQSNTLGAPNTNRDGAFTLSPNPTTYMATIKASEGKKVESVQLYNTLGQNIFDKRNINTDSFQIPMHQYSKGLYLVKINDKETKKLVLK